MSGPDLPAALGELQEKLAGGIPDSGPFVPISVLLPWPGQESRAVLSVGPLQDFGKHDEKIRRFVDVTVRSPSGDGHASQWVLTGTSGEILAFLKSPEAVPRIRETLLILVEKADELR